MLETSIQVIPVTRLIHNCGWLSVVTGESTNCSQTLELPALSHSADPSPDSTLSTQLVPYNRNSSSAPRVSVLETLDMHGELFQILRPFTECQVTRTKRHVPLLPMTFPTWCCLRCRQSLLWFPYPLLRPKQDGLFPSQIAATDDLKKKPDKVHLQWPSLKRQFQSSLLYPGTVPSWSSSQVRYFRTVASSSSSEFVERNLLKTEFPTTHNLSPCHNVGFHMCRSPWCFEISP